MKPLTIGLVTLLFICAWLLFQQHLELKKLGEIQVKTIQGLKRENREQFDSLTYVVRLKSDSLSIAFTTIKYLNTTNNKSGQVIKDKTQDHETIIFVNLNDSARHRKLAKLFPSYVHP